jgi:hypothetical protein
MTYTTDQRNNAIAARMGGPIALREALGHHDDAEFDFETLEDLRFEGSWDWLIPVWKKVRFDLSPVQVIAAIGYIDDDNIKELYQLLSQVCISWCNTNNLKL